MKPTSRLALICGGMFTMAVCWAIQTTSVFTPAFAKQPILFSMASMAGTLLLGLAALVLVIVAMYLRQPALSSLAVIYLLLVLLFQVTFLGKVFQTGIAGLTLGVSLILLGCIPFRLPSKKKL